MTDTNHNRPKHQDQPYTCARCGGEFINDRSDEEIEEDLKAEGEGAVAVCEECFELIVWAESHPREAGYTIH